MITKILFITLYPQNYVISSLTECFTNAGYEVEICGPHVSLIEDLESTLGKENFPSIIMFNLEGVDAYYSKLCPYLKKLISEDGVFKKLYLLGSPSEFKQVYEYIQQEQIAYAFERPIDREQVLKVLRQDDTNFINGKTNIYFQQDPSKKTVLIVDDDLVYLEAMKRWLSGNYNVFTLNNGTQVLDVLKTYKISLVLLDYEMPLLSGYDILQLLKNDPNTSNIPVALLTGNDDMKIVKEILAQKPIGYLLKTTPPIILRKKIEEFLEIKRKG